MDPTLVAPVPPLPTGKVPVTSEVRSTEVPSVVSKLPEFNCNPVPVKSVMVSDPLVKLLTVKPLNVGLEVVKRSWLRLTFAPLTVSVLEVVPPAIWKPSALAVNDNPLTVLLVRFSVPAKVASVPVVGKVNAVAPVVVNDKLFAPTVLKLPAKARVPVVHVGVPVPPESNTCPAEPTDAPMALDPLP